LGKTDFQNMKIDIAIKVASNQKVSCHTY